MDSPYGTSTYLRLELVVFVLFYFILVYFRSDGSYRQTYVRDFWKHVI